MNLNEFFRVMLFLPEQASNFAKPIDHLHYFVISATMVASFLVGTAALVFFIRYRRSVTSGVGTSLQPSLGFEVTIVVVPLSFFLLWFAIGFRQYVWMTTPPKDAMDVYVMGKKWMWKFAYPGGPNAIGELRIPVGRPVRLLMTSRDVIHSFYVPAFRLKQDVLPGRYTQLWFVAEKPGRYQIFCAEYCGLGHSAMWGEVVAMRPDEFDAWRSDVKRGVASRQDGGAVDDDLDFTSTGNIVSEGQRIAVAKGCISCHSTDGSPHIGPTWLDLYGKREKLTSGESVLADEAYLTESMMDPRARIVAGYQAVMPTYQGKLEGPEAAAIVEFIKSLRTHRVENEPSKGPRYEPVRREQ